MFEQKLSTLQLCLWFLSRRQWVREEDLAKDLKLHTKQLRRTLRFFEEEKLVTRDHRKEVSFAGSALWPKAFCTLLPLFSSHLFVLHSASSIAESHALVLFMNFLPPHARLGVGNGHSLPFYLDFKDTIISHAYM